MTLQGDELSCVVDGCIGGHLKLLVPNGDRGSSVDLEHCRENWRDSCSARTYTLAGHRPESLEIDIEFAIHPCDAGPGGAWAQNARVGDQALITNPKKKKLRRSDAGFYVFVCDSCSMPAVHAALRDIPTSSKGVVLMHCDDVSDCTRVVESHPEFSAHYLKRDLSIPPSVIAATHLGVLRSLDIPTEDTECFVVGESRTVREVKGYILDVLMIDTDGMYFSAYWKHAHDQDQHKQAKKAERDQGAALEVPSRKNKQHAQQSKV